MARVVNNGLSHGGGDIYRKFVIEEDSLKWKDRHPEYEFAMTIADTDLNIDAGIKQAIVNRLNKVNNFTYKTISEEYSASVINWLKQRHCRSPGLDIQASHIIGSPSLATLIYVAIHALTQQNEGVLIFTPVWATYKKTIKFLQRNLVQCPLIKKKQGGEFRYEIDFDDLKKKAKQSKLVLLCSPHNPSGRIWSHQEINQIVQICKDNDLYLLSDQILADLVPDALLPSFYSLLNENYDKLIVGNSISKSFNMQSLKGGYAIVKDKNLNDRIRLNFQAMSTSLSEFALRCTTIVYSEMGKEWLRYSTGIIRNNHQSLVERMKTTKLAISQYEGSQLIVLDFEGYLKPIERWFNDSGQPCQQRNDMVKLFLNKRGMYGISLPQTGTPDQPIYTDIRFNIGVQESVLKSFADRLYFVLLELQSASRKIDPRL